MPDKPLIIQGSFDFEAPAEILKTPATTTNKNQLFWIVIAKNSPYFTTANGDPWTPIGQNDGITWPELSGAFRRKDLVAVEAYFCKLLASGVNCLRLMLEYCQGENRYLEKPTGYFQPNMVRLWDDIFALCEKYSLRVLLTPYDTFWMWRRWSNHPYNHNNNGPCSKRSQWLFCSGMRSAIKQRLQFATERWGSSGVIFGWDLWNEIRPSHGGNSVKGFADFINDVGSSLRDYEISLFGRAHLQTVSVFSPVLQKDWRIADYVFRHTALDFATIHLYELNSIDNPKNTIDAAISTGRIIRKVLSEIEDNRPFFDSEHGPIKTFIANRKTLPEAFDDEYFRHMQWAHLASGGAGGGMRWPYRHPHILTTGMRRAQLALSQFLPLISWNEFQRVNINDEIELSDKGLAAFGCADEKQAVIWLLRINSLDKNKQLHTNYKADPSYITIPVLKPGDYTVTFWNTVSALQIEQFNFFNDGLMKLKLPPVITDVAIAIRLNGIV